MKPTYEELQALALSLLGLARQHVPDWFKADAVELERCREALAPLQNTNGRES